MIKKWICLLLALTMLSGVMVWAEPATKYGDVDNSGKVNAGDALSVLRFVVGKEPLDETQQKMADVSDDGAITAEDALHILQFVVGKRTIFDVELLTPVSGLDSLKLYKTDVSAFNYEYPVTLTQIGYGYDGKYDVDVDCLLGYASGSRGSGSSMYWSLWPEKYEYEKDIVRGLMTPINRDSGEYRKKYPERGMMDVQTDYSGNYMDHPTEDYYMVPTDSYIEYKWEMLQSHLDTGHIKFVALEEPEFFNKAGYSEGYKEAYEKYSGKEYDEFYDLFADGMYEHQAFRTYLFYHAFDVLSSRIKEKYPDVEVYVASHCTLNYGKHNINSCVGAICSLPTIDGVIAQVWSDSVNMNFYYDGGSLKNPFATALYEYNCYDEMLRDDQKLYLLQDPSSDDTSLPAEDKEALWHDTVVGSMMQNATAMFETPIWPGRAIGGATDEYKTVQMNAQQMFGELHKYDAQLYTGTPGVAFAMSDSAAWHRWTTGYIGNYINSCTGVTYPLMNDGIAVDTVWLDNLTSVDQLADVNLMILTYDVMKPLDPKVNQVIAQWVKDGGRLLYYGGTNNFDTLEETWWGKAGVTPLQHLIGQLGLSIQVNQDLPGAEPIQWEGSAIDGEMLSYTYAQYALSFTGSGFTSFMKVKGKNLGITAKCGKGQVTMAGIPAPFYSSSKAAGKAVIDLATMALKGAATPYSGSSVFVAKRGNYYGIHTLQSGVKLDANKTFIDLFTPTLKVKKGGTLAKDKSYLYYDMTEALQKDVPVLAFSGSTLLDQTAFANNQSSFRVVSPSGTTVATAFACNGKEVDSITAVDENGDVCKVETSMDQNVLVVRTTITAKLNEETSHTTENNYLNHDYCSPVPVTVTINWK